MQILIPLFFLTFCFCLGSFPLTNLIVKSLTSIDLRKVGTGNISVSAAFIHAPKPVAIITVLAEITRGIVPVLAAKLLFPEIPSWQLVGLIFLVLGRYLIAKGGGVTNACWGVLVYDPVVAFGSGFTGFLILLICEKLFTRKNQNIRQWAARFGCLSGFFWVLLFRQSASFLELFAAAGLGIILVIINIRQSDDMALQKQPIFSLEDKLEPKTCGEKAARLALLKKASFNIPQGLVLPAMKEGNREFILESEVKKSIPNSQLSTACLSVDKILDKLDGMSVSFPLIVRSSAIGEDSDNSSAAGQYQTIFPVNNETELLEAINICRQSYWLAEAVNYRRQRQIPDTEMAVLIQSLIISQVAGVMFTRNPLDGGAKIIIEALPGGAEKVVGGQLTPVHLEIDKNRFYDTQISTVKDKGYNSVDKSVGLENQDILPLKITQELVNEEEENDKSVGLENQDILPLEIIQELVEQAEAIEGFFHGLPQDIEWCWDGEKIWILQSRPITNLRPIWTRTIAAEVIPGAIHPLTWSINRPLTCGVWGEIFTIILGGKVANLDFTETATLLGSHAYFNATLLGEIFRMMGLPEQGLEFLLRGQKMGKPPLRKVWSALPGLWRLIQKEMAVDRDFEGDYYQIFVPALQSLENNFKRDFQQNFQQSLKENSSQSLSELLAEAEQIQEWLKPITYYNILGPIGLAIRRSLFRVSEEWLPTDTAPEIVSIRELQKLAVKLKMATNSDVEIEVEFEQNRELQREFQQWLESYGYLSEVGTDISVATWREKPDNFRNLLFVMAGKDEREKESFSGKSLNFWQRWRLAQCAKRAKTKGKIAEVYGKL
ncbi:MAG: glycerol-3-phosphate acyltransferase, partial [Trichodesmium sp.]